jgi:hypothetical protein
MAGLAPEKGSRREAQGTVPRNRRQHRGMRQRLRENQHAIAPAILRPRLGLRQGPRNRPERVSGANDRRRLPIFLAMGRLSHCRPIAEARPRMPDPPPEPGDASRGRTGRLPSVPGGRKRREEGLAKGHAVRAMARGSTERSLAYGRLGGTPESGKGEQQAMAEAIPLRYLPPDGFEAKAWYELMTIYRDLCPGSQAAYGPRWIFRGEGEVRGDRALRPSWSEWLRSTD